MKKLNREELENADLDIKAWMSEMQDKKFAHFLATSPVFVRGSGCKTPPRTGTFLYADGREVLR